MLISYQYLGDTYLASVSSPLAGTYSLGYDALGRCVKKTTNGQVTYFIYDGDRAIIEYNPNAANPSSAFIASTIYGRGTDEILSRNNYGSNQYILPDRNGNTLAVTGATGYILESYRYDAFGTPTIRKPDGTISQMTRADGSVIPVSAINNRFLFAGREYAAKFGFYEYRARAYHPGLGRFMSEDPKGFDAGDYNLYRYCDNDPLDLTDPMGSEVWYHGSMSDYREARAVAMHDSLARRLILTAERMQSRLDIYGREIGKRERFSHYDPRTKTITWDPRGGVILTGGGLMSPARVLVHEIDHAVADATDHQGYKDRVDDKVSAYGNQEERRAVLGAERSLGKKLGEGLREDHNGQRSRTAGPSSPYPQPEKLEEKLTFTLGSHIPQRTSE